MFTEPSKACTPNSNNVTQREVSGIRSRGKREIAATVYNVHNFYKKLKSHFKLKIGHLPHFPFFFLIKQYSYYNGSRFYPIALLLNH